MAKKKIPRWLQPTVWSVKVENLDLEKDKVYIINQVLVYGGFKAWRWLFKTYPKKTIIDVFVSQPLKIYTLKIFNFIKEILLNIKDKNLKIENYDRSLPRIIRS